MLHFYLKVKYRIIELENFSGPRGAVYSVILDGSSKTLFDLFLEENKVQYRKELRSIIDRIRVIGLKTGAREQFFKIYEGKPGDGVCALYDEEDSLLRLYCIRYASIAIILGGGGPKLKEISAWQEDKKLSEEVNILTEISKDISRRILNKELEWSYDGRLIGNLNFMENEEDN